MRPIRRFILLVVLALCAVAVTAAAASSALAAPKARTAPAAATSWTYAIYCDGDNNLERYWDQYSLPWLLEVPASTGLRIVAMRDRLSTTGTELVEISGGVQTVVATYPEKDFGDGATFRWFIETVHALYPSTHLAVTMWDHGYAWRYICKDDTSGGDAITMDELHAAIAGAGVPIDILAFDACNMGAVDVAYEVAPTGLVRLMIASEESVPANGYPYDEMLTPLAQDPSRTPAQAAADMVAGWKVYYDGQNWANNAQLAAVDVATIGAAAGDLQAWRERLAADLPLYKKKYTAELSLTWHAWASNHYDLGDYCRNLLADDAVTDVTLKRLTQSVLADVEAAVIAESTAPSSADATGLTIWWNSKVDWNTHQNGLPCSRRFRPVNPHRHWMVELPERLRREMSSKRPG